jgi:hypothetical protein
MSTFKSAWHAGFMSLFGLLALAQGAPALAGSPPHYPPGWQHRPPPASYYHPHPGQRYVVVDRLPHGCRHVVYRGQPYYYQGANWYRPYGARFAMVAPPAGLIIDSRGMTLAAWVPLVRW